jgi:hypothetical protein
MLILKLRLEMGVGRVLLCGWKIVLLLETALYFFSFKGRFVSIGSYDL